MNTKLIPCNSCGHQIAKSASKCPSCGAARTTAPRLILIAFVTVVLVFVLGGGAYCTVITATNRALDGMQERARGR